MSQRLVLGSVVAALLLLGGFFGWKALDRLPEPTPSEEPIALAAPELAPSPAIAPPPEPEPPASARVAEPARSDEVRFSGTVCALDPSTRILPGAEVWTRPAGAEERVLRDVTDERGRFSFDAPPEEESTVFIEAEGYAPFRAPVSEHAFERYWYSHSREVRDDGAHISLGVIELWPGVELAGRASFEDGSPAVGAELFLLWNGANWEPFLPLVELAVGRSIEGGVLAFDGRVPAKMRAGEGNHLLVAVLGDLLGCARFAAFAGRDSIGDLQVVLRAGCPLRVPVRDEVGRPIAGARVTVDRNDYGSLQTKFREDWSRLPVPMPAAIERFFVSSTDAEGIAHFPAVPIINPDGSVRRERVRLEVHAAAEGYVSGSERGRLEDGVFRVMMPLTLKAAGRLRLSGRVLDHDGEPLEGALVELQRPEVTATSGEDGRWEIVPPPGTLLADLGGLVFRQEGFVDWSISVPGGDPSTTDIDVGDVRLGRPAGVSGRVVDDLGNAVSGVRVSIIRADGGHAFDRPWPRSGADGCFVDENAPEGELELRVVLIEETRDFVEPWEPLRIRGGDQGVVLVLERRPWNEGRVVAEITDARTGAALDALLAGVRHSEIGAGRPLPSVGLSAGRVTIDRLEVGRYLLWVQVAERPLAVAGFEIEEGSSEVLLRIPVEEAGSIRGQLLGDGPVDFSSASVELVLETSNGSFNPALTHPKASASLGSLKPDAEGRFHWADLTPGRWQVFVRCGEQTAGPAPFEVRPGELSELELRLEPGARLIVEVGPGEPGQTGRPRGFLMFFVTTCTDGGTRRNMGYMVPLKGPAPGSDERSLRVVIPPGRTEYEIRLDDLESEPLAQGVVELGQGEEHRVSLPDQE